MSDHHSDHEKLKKIDVLKDWIERNMPSPSSPSSSSSASHNNHHHRHQQQQQQSTLSSLESFLFLPQLPVDGGEDGDEGAWLFRAHHRTTPPPPSLVTTSKSKSSSTLVAPARTSSSTKDKRRAKQYIIPPVNSTISSTRGSGGRVTCPSPSRGGGVRDSPNRVCGDSNNFPANPALPFAAANNNDPVRAASNCPDDDDESYSKCVNKSTQQSVVPQKYSSSSSSSSLSIFIKNSSNSPGKIGSGHHQGDHSSPFYLAANHVQQQQHHHQSLVHHHRSSTQPPHHHLQLVARRRLFLFRLCQAFSVLLALFFLVNLVKNSLEIIDEEATGNSVVPPHLTSPSSPPPSLSRLQNRLVQSWNMPSIISPSSAYYSNESTSSSSSSNSNLFLLDMPNFRFLMNNKTKCNIATDPNGGGGGNEGGAAASSVFFMIIVHSAPQNFVERSAIRNTWGSLQSLGQFQLRLVFLLGGHELTGVSEERQANNPDGGGEDSDGKEEQEEAEIYLKIQRESELHGDIVSGSFHDSYRNLTVKHLMGYLWVLHHCSHAKYVLKADDDAFIDIFQLFEFLLRTFGPEPEAALICNVFPEGTKPVRRADLKGKKWAVTYEEYPYETYPKYCGGLAYLATPNVIHEIYRMSLNSSNKYLWIDDVYVTGILRELARVEPFYLNLRYSYEPEDYRKWLLSPTSEGAGPGGPQSHRRIVAEKREGGSNDGVGVAVLSNRMKEDELEGRRPSPSSKIPFMIVHLERGASLPREMTELWNKTLAVWSRAGLIF